MFATVALWPVEGDLLVATDYESTCFSDGTEPVMYLSEDTIGLLLGEERFMSSLGPGETKTNP